jgi:micrococcal nuclease
VANKDSKTFHRADCAFVAKMKPANRVSFASATEAAKAGYKPCKVCKPE